jgi:hypothetical protein
MKGFEYVPTAQTAKIATGFRTQASFTKDIDLNPGADLTLKDTLWLHATDGQPPDFKDATCTEFATVALTLPKSVREGLTRHERPALYGGAYLQVAYEISVQIGPFVAARCLFKGWFIA